jgi:hypothetical protein
MQEISSAFWPSRHLALVRSCYYSEHPRSCQMNFHSCSFSGSSCPSLCNSRLQSLAHFRAAMAMVVLCWMPGLRAEPQNGSVMRQALLVCKHLQNLRHPQSHTQGVSRPVCACTCAACTGAGAATARGVHRAIEEGRGGGRGSALVHPRRLRGGQLPGLRAAHAGNRAREEREISGSGERACGSGEEGIGFEESTGSAMKHQARDGHCKGMRGRGEGGAAPESAASEEALGLLVPSSCSPLPATPHTVAP